MALSPIRPTEELRGRRVALSLIWPMGKDTWPPDGAITYLGYGKVTWLPEMLLRPDKA